MAMEEGSFRLADDKSLAIRVPLSKLLILLVRLWVLCRIRHDLPIIRVFYFIQKLELGAGFAGDDDGLTALLANLL